MILGLYKVPVSGHVVSRGTLEWAVGLPLDIVYLHGKM